MTRRWRAAQAAFTLAAVVFVMCVFVPQALAFPYQRQFGDTRVYAEQPIPDTMTGVLAQSDLLLRSSAIYGPGYGKHIFLTDGGWRWRLLTLQLAGTFALTRSFSEAIVVNRSDIAGDRVMNGGSIAGERSLSGVIAHERTHGLIRAHFGRFADFRYPAWLREGYCDEVAGGGNLSDREAASLIARRQSVPALVYYQGRKRVEAILRNNGGSVDKLFATL